MMARMLMSENLCICSQATLELMKLWQDYKSYLFVKLPEPRDNVQNLQDFISNQDGQMQSIKSLLISDWTKSASDILREEQNNLDKDQKARFFESTATLMANQVRELIEQSVRTYVEFIQRFKKDSYPTPEEIIQREYKPDVEFEDCFICVKLTIEGTEIVFENNLEDNVQPELENIIDAIVKQSHNLPRPENSWSRGDKMHLWVVPEDDEVMDEAKKTVSKIIEENRKVVETAINVYKDYMWILDEGAKVADFVDTKNSQNYNRETFQARIDSYQATIDKIRDEMPFEIRMNMFLIECKDINDQLCERLENLISQILTKVTEYVFAN